MGVPSSQTSQLKAASDEAAATRNHTISTAPPARAMPVMRCEPESTISICSL